MICFRVKCSFNIQFSDQFLLKSCSKYRVNLKSRPGVTVNDYPNSSNSLFWIWENMPISLLLHLFHECGDASFCTISPDFYFMLLVHLDTSKVDGVMAIGCLIHDFVSKYVVVQHTWFHFEGESVTSFLPKTLLITCSHFCSKCYFHDIILSLRNYLFD